MTILKILKSPHPLLKKKTKKLNIKQIETKRIQSLIKQMIETMRSNQGIGLSANQVGFNLSIFVVEHKEKPLVFINPEIIKYSWLKSLGEEGCLSLPGIWVEIKRSRSIKIKAISEKGKEFQMKAKGLLARVIQHEYDHLNGILILDRKHKILKGKELLKKYGYKM